jgi:hypothetical protein
MINFASPAPGMAASLLLVLLKSLVLHSPLKILLLFQLLKRDYSLFLNLLLITIVALYFIYEAF